MNTDFTITNNKAIIFTDNKDKSERYATNNIEDILICENNIEEIEYNLHESKNQITFLQNKMWFNWGTIASAILWVGAGIFTVFINSQAWISIIPFLCAAGLSLAALDDIKSNLKLIKAEKCVINELENNLQREKDKLNEFNKDKSNNLITDTQYIKPICKSEEMYNLKRKLKVIKYYQKNKGKLIKAYKKGILKQITSINLFSYKDNLLLEELIKNDLNKVNTNKNTKQKILEKK